MQVTEHFHSREFASKADPYPEEWIGPRLTPLCMALEVIRETLGGLPLVITSGYRSAAHNEALIAQAKRQGWRPPAKHSLHIEGKAADFLPPKPMHPERALEIIEGLIQEKLIPQGGLSLYPDGHIHYDIRGTRARW